MCLLLETIKIIDGEIRNISLHDERMNRSRCNIFSTEDHLRLSDYIKIPQEAKIGIVRCRVIYGSSVQSVEYSQYTPADIKTLKIVESGNIVYDLKYLDRSSLNALVDKSIADDILIVRDGCLTDASFANIVFYDGIRWITPDTPLLCGTMRKMLLREGAIDEERITVDDLSRFTHFRLINAMLGFDAPALPVSNIIRE